MFIFCGCSNDDNEPNPNNDIDSAIILAINISEVTKDADMMLLCKDGSYMICDFENEKGYGVVYTNSSIDNETSEGIMTFVDEDGKPVMSTYGDYHIIYKNVTDESFDYALIDKNGETSYYWDVKVSDSSLRRNATRMYNPFTSTWSTIKNFNWTWDEHQKKALLPALAKVLSFSFTAFETVHTGNPLGMFLTFYIESCKSDGEDPNKWIEGFAFFDGVIDVDFGKILSTGKLNATLNKTGILSNVINEWADQEFEKMGQYEENVAPTFEGKEWQIKLSINLLQCSPEEKEYRIDVTSKATWEIDASNMNNGWCNIRQDEGQVVVKVKAYEGMETRQCSAKIKTKIYKEEISPALLTIIQEGFIFELSAKELVFNENGGNRTITIETNDNILSWKVTSHPDWCKAYSIYNGLALTVSVDENKNLIEDKEGIITLTAETKNGATIDRTLKVRQIAQNWNGTSWNFNGKADVSGFLAGIGGLDVTNITNFGISIIDVATNKFSLSGDLTGCESYSDISLDDKNRLILNFTQNISGDGASAKIKIKIIFERKDETKAIGEMTGSANLHILELGNGNMTMSGIFNGTKK